MWFSEWDDAFWYTMYSIKNKGHNSFLTYTFKAAEILKIALKNQLQLRKTHFYWAWGKQMIITLNVKKLNTPIKSG